MLALSAVPVIDSHTGCRAFTPGYARNLDDAMIQRLAGRGGVILVAFGSVFLDEAARAAYTRITAARDAARDALGLPPTDRAPRHDADPQIREWYRSYAETHPEVAESGRRPSGAAS